LAGELTSGTSLLPYRARRSYSPWRQLPRRHGIRWHGAHIVRVYFFELQALMILLKSVTAEGRARNLEDIGAQVGDFLLDVQVAPWTRVIT